MTLYRFTPALIALRVMLSGVKPVLALALRRHARRRGPQKKGGVPNGRPPHHDAVSRLNRLL